MTCHPSPPPKISSIFFQQWHACHFGDNPLRAEKGEGSVSGIMIWMHNLCCKASTMSSSSHGGPHTDVSNSTFQGHRTKLVLLMQPGSSAQFRWSVFTFDLRRDVRGREGVGLAWIPKHRTLKNVRGGWGGGVGGTRLLCRQSPFSANRSKSLFVLDLCSTPSPPTPTTQPWLQHSFISLHPLVQFGHIIPCLSRGNLHKGPSAHIWFIVCAHTRGDPRRRGEICNAIKTYPISRLVGFGTFPFGFLDCNCDGTDKTEP